MDPSHCQSAAPTQSPGAEDAHGPAAAQVQGYHLNREEEPPHQLTDWELKLRDTDQTFALGRSWVDLPTFLTPKAGRILRESSSEGDPGQAWEREDRFGDRSFQ